MTDPRYTDPLHVPGDEPTHERLQLAYEAGLADGAHTRILTVAVALVLGAILASTFLLANHVLAAPRPVSELSGLASAPAEVQTGLVQGQSEAPQAGVRFVGPSSSGASPEPSAGARPLAAPTQLDDGGGIAGTAPPDTAVDLAHGRTGIIALATGHGPDYLAVPIGPGHLVEVCGPGGCWTSVSTDGGPNHAMLQAGRIADVAVGHWEHVCGLDRSRGLCRGSWRVLGEGLPTPPATDR